jgi:hypothetical protein
MERAYPYKGYHIRICVEAFTEPALRGVVSHEVDFVSVVKIFNMGASLPLFPPLRLTHTDGHRLATLSDAILSGFAAGRRLVDDLLQDATA